MIQIKEVSKAFSGAGVVAPLSLTIETGDFATFLGPSGCGKSTLLRMIAGLEKPDTGSVNVEGNLAYVFQDAHLLPWRTVLRNVELPLELSGVSPQERKAAAHQALREVNLEDALDRYPNQLSGGMKMRVSLARALVTQPKILLLDEPFAALDEIIRHRLGELLRKIWREQRMTVVFVTHSMSEATYLSRRAIVFSKRPARIVLDRMLELPETRTRELRASAEFGSEVKRLGDAFEEVEL